MTTTEFTNDNDRVLTKIDDTRTMVGRYSVTIDGEFDVEVSLIAGRAAAALERFEETGDIKSLLATMADLGQKADEKWGPLFDKLWRDEAAKSVGL